MEMVKHSVEIPELIPVLPVRNTVLFPNAAVPLVVGRNRSVKALKEAQQHGNLLLVVAQKDPASEDPKATELYKVGVVCLVSKVNKSDNDSYQLIANGLFRFEVSEFVEEGKILRARGAQLPDLAIESPARVEALLAEVKDLAKSILNLAAIPGADTLAKLFQQLEDAGQISDLCGTFLHVNPQVKQELLEMLSLEKRLERLTALMVQEKERLGLQQEIQSKMAERLSKDQRDHLLREQLRTIHEELGDESGIQSDFATRIEKAGMSEEAKKAALEELSRLGMVQRSSPEYHVIRTYLDWLIALPWQKESGIPSESIDLMQARAILDEDHFGIDRVKKRIIEFLAVTKLKKDLRGPVLCLVGPPGVGKTSVAKSIARALGRKFIRTSLGGVRDEAEIRGHRRTYIGSLPGRIIQSLKRAEVRDPVLLLDEIDKVGTDFRGDPSSALLELLDPEQNTNFMDHYLDVSFDMSRIFFITTANTLDTIPPALRDRLEIIEMSSYTNAEKFEIAKRHLLPQLAEEHGMKPEQVDVPAESLTKIIEGYTREAGVRNLKRELSHLFRALAVDFSKQPELTTVSLPPERLESILGPRKFYSESAQDLKRPGLVTGLAWTPVGGEILHIEVTAMMGKGNLILTGQLGEVMKESAQIALSLVRALWGERFPLPMDKTDFHIHVPAGAIPKDGPSAGVAIFTALVSLLEDTPVISKLGMTGEITLRGAVMPVGGIKEKVVAAHRAGIRTILLPRRNEADLTEIPEEVKSELTFHFIDDILNILPLVGLSAPPPLPPPRYKDIGIRGTPGLSAN